MEGVKNPDGTWRVKGVPIISTGIEYPLSTGMTTFSDEQLSDAVAALKDPAIVAPRIKLGHSSDYNSVLVGDAEQAFGRIDPDTMHLADNGQTIYGDYTGMPEWLASVLPMAYPNRSIEGNFDVQTVTGKEYKMVIKAVSLLGVEWPGCQVLEDLPLWYGSDVPEGVVVQELVKAAGGGMGNSIEALVDVDQVRRKFYTEVATDDQYWWWIRGMKYDNSTGLQLIVDDEQNGDLYRVPVTVTTDDITFGDPVTVTEDFPDKNVAASAVIAGMRMFDKDMLVYATRAESRPDINQEGATMDEATRLLLASRLGLPEDASEDQVNAKLDEGQAAIAASQGDPGDEDDSDDPDDPDNTGTQPEHETDQEASPGPPGQAQSGVVSVDAGMLEELKAGAALATKHESERRGNLIKATVSDAVEAGKIPPARRKHWETTLAADYDGGKAVLDSLEGGLVPVHMRGNAGNADDGTSDGSDGMGLPESWFPEISTMRAAAHVDKRVLHAREG